MSAQMFLNFSKPTMPKLLPRRGSSATAAAVVVVAAVAEYNVRETRVCSSYIKIGGRSRSSDEKKKTIIKNIEISITHYRFTSCEVGGGEGDAFLNWSSDGRDRSRIDSKTFQNYTLLRARVNKCDRDQERTRTTFDGRKTCRVLSVRNT